MNQEQLSALLDGELDELATVRLLRALDQDEETLERWDAYALIGEALRERDAPSAAGAVGARRALEQIRAEAAPPAAVSRPVQLRPYAPWALAASAAAIAFLVSGGPVGQAVAERSGGAWDFVQLSVLGSGAQLAEPAAASQEDMERYIALHRAVAAPGFERTSFATGAVGGSDQGQ